MKLGDIARENRETYKGDKTGIPIVGLEHLIPQELTFEDYDIDVDNTFTKVFHKGQILFGRRRAYLKKAAVANFDGICSGDITVIEAIPGKVDKNLLPFIIQNDALFDYAVSRSAGGLSPRVKWEQLSDYEIELPSLEEQKVLADKLWAAYRLTEGYKKLIAAIDEMVKSQFIEMFKYSQRIELGSLATFINGSAFKPEEWYKEGLPIVRIQNLTQPEAQYNYYNGDVAKKVLIRRGDILVSWSATLGVFTWNEGDACLNQHIFKVIFDKLDVDKTFFIYTVQNVLDKMYKKAHGSTMKHVTKKIFDSTEVVYPSKDDQRHFVEIACHADKSKFELKQCIENIDKVIKSLING